MKEKWIKYKGVAILIGICAVLVLAIVLIAGKNPLYGSYKATKLLYLSPLSHVDEETFADSFTEIEFSKKVVSVECEELQVSFTKPKIQTKKMTEELAVEFESAMWGENPVSVEGVQKVHYILDAEGKITNHMLWETEDGLMLVKYFIVDNKTDIWFVISIEKNK